MVKNITIEQVLNRQGVVLVDVRSEGEFAEGTIPGAINISLLNNEERAMVGIQYKEKGPNAAKRLGLQLVGPRISELVKRFDEAASDRMSIVVFCWRGGLRSKIVAQLLNMLDFDVYIIIGGYKSYRRYVNSYLEKKLNHKAVVFHGLTGTGKTLVLKKLAQHGLPVLDLESLAVHRGSVFGKVGLPSSPTQKDFEAQIFKCLKNYEPKGYFLVECESKRLGRLLIPNSVMNSMKSGIKILLYSSLEIRVRRSMDEYAKGFSDKDNTKQLIEATKALSKYIGHRKADLLCYLIDNGKRADAVELLLEKYYDPLYRYPNQPSPDYDYSVDSTDIESAVESLTRYITGLLDNNLKVSGGV